MSARGDTFGESVNVGRLFARVRRRALGTTVLAVLLFAAAALVITTLKPRYQTEALVQIGAHGNRLFDTPNIAVAKPEDVEAVLSEVQVLQSYDVLADVVRRLSLQDVGEFNGHDRTAPEVWFANLVSYLQAKTGIAPAPDEADLSDPVNYATLELQKHVWVDSAGRSRVIRVVASSENAARSAAIVNALIDAYLDRQAAMKEAEGVRTLGVLKDRIANLQRQTEAADRNVEAYRQKMQLFRVQGALPNSDSSLASQQLQTLSANLATAVAAREEAEARVRAANTYAGGGTNADAISNRLIQELSDQETTLRAKQAELASRNGPSHPAMLAVNAQLREVRSKITSETARVLQTFRNEVEVARARERGIAEQVAKVKVEVARYDDAAVPLRAAEQQAETSHKLLNDLTRRQHEVEALRGAQEPDAERVSVARAPLVPYFPRTKALLFVAAIGSIGASIALNLAFEMRNRGVWSGDEVRDVFGINCLGLVPLVNTTRRRSPADMITLKPNSAFAEAIRTVSVWLDVLHGTGTGRTVLITSAVPGEGKTSMAMALARQAAESNERVVVVDLDFRRPSMHKIGKVALTPGVAAVLTGEVQLDQALRKDSGSDAFLLPAGDADNPTALLRGQAMKDLIANLRLRFDLVVLDSPPTSVVADTRIVARAADAVVFVTKWGSTGRDLVAAELRSLEEAGATVIGVTLNHVNAREHARYGYSDSGIYRGKAKKYYIN